MIEFIILGIGIISLIASKYYWNKKWFILGGILIIVSMIIQLSVNESYIWKRIIVGIILGTGLAFTSWGLFQVKTVHLPGETFLKRRKGKNLTPREKKILEQFLNARKGMGISYTRDIKNALR